MYSVRTRENLGLNPKNINFSYKDKYDIERLRTNPSYFTKTLETVDSRMNFQQTYFFSPQQIITSNTFEQRGYDNLFLNSKIRLNSQIDKQSIAGFLADIKMLTFISTQNQQTKQYILKKQKYLNTLRQQIQDNEESIRYSNKKYEKKLNEYNIKKNKFKKVKSRKLQQMEEQFEELARDIKKMKNKIKFRKLKTEPINTSNLLDKSNVSGVKQAHRVVYPTYYLHHMYPPQPHFYLQQPGKPLSNRNYFQQFPQMEHAYEWQNRLHQSNFNHHNIEIHKMKTQATYESKGCEQPLSASRKRSQSNGFQNTPNNNKNQKTYQQRNSHRSSFKMTNSINMKVKKQQSWGEDTKQKKILCELGYLSSQYQSENQSRLNAFNNEKQTLKSKTTPVQILINEESQCQPYRKPVQSESDQWMGLCGQSKVKVNKNSVPLNFVLDTIKVPDDKSQKNSSKGSNFSNVNMNVTISSQDKNKQTVRSSSEQSKKRSVGESIVAISMSGVASSKISKRSKSNSISEQRNQTKQTNRYMPHLAKEFTKIEQENEEIASLKTTPNQFGTPRNTSFNDKSMTPTNSQNKKKISTIQQQQQPISPLKKPPTLVPQKKENQQLQYDHFLSKIRLNTQSKKFPDLSPITPKEDDDFLAAICLVGQSKISRLKSQSQRMSTSQNRNDFDEIGSLKVNSQIKKQNLQKEPSFDDFDFILGGQSKITKKNNQTPNKNSFQQSPSIAQEKSRFNRGSWGFSVQDNTIQQKEQEYDEYPSNKANNKKKMKQ